MERLPESFMGGAEGLVCYAKGPATMPTTYRSGGTLSESVPHVLSRQCTNVKTSAQREGIFVSKDCAVPVLLLSQTQKLMRGSSLQPSQRLLPVQTCDMPAMKPTMSDSSAPSVTKPLHTTLSPSYLYPNRPYTLNASSPATYSDWGLHVE